MSAFRWGADGVLIGGCHPGDCHYQEGNYKALRRFTMLKKLVAAMGIEDERLASILEHSGIGVSNVNERLKVLFGADYRLSITSQKGEGTRTTIEIPA